MFSGLEGLLLGGGSWQLVWFLFLDVPRGP